MHYLIDGYNLLFAINDEVDPFPEKRLEIIESLSAQISSRRLSASLIFDSGGADTFPSRHLHTTLEIIYTPQGQSADNYIVEALSWAKTEHTVVTNDRGLARSCRELGATILSTAAFLKFLSKKKKVAPAVPHDSPREIERLRRIFEKKLDEKG